MVTLMERRRAVAFDNIPSVRISRFSRHFLAIASPVFIHQNRTSIFYINFPLYSIDLILYISNSDENNNVAVRRLRPKAANIAFNNKTKCMFLFSISDEYKSVK